MALGQENLIQAIIAKLLTDIAAGGLVELTGNDDASEKFRIARGNPIQVGDTPFLGVMIFQSVPLIGSTATHVQKARVYFRAWAAKDLTAIKIADRLEDLLHDRTGASNLGYYDFSSDEISNRMTRFKQRDLAVHDDDKDVFMILIQADVIWVDEPC